MQPFHVSTLVRVALALLTGLVLVACSQDQTPKPRSQHQGVISSTVYTSVTTAELKEAILGILAPEAITTTALTEAWPGMYMTEAVTIGPDGRLSVPLPAVSEIPTALTVPAAKSVFNTELITGCELTSSDAAIRTTATYFYLFTTPAIYFILPNGYALGVTTAERMPEAPQPEDFFTARVQTWMHASGPTRLSTPAGGCVDTAEGITITVDVELETGWNRIEWTGRLDELGQPVETQLRNSTATELYTYAMLGTQPTSASLDPDVCRHDHLPARLGLSMEPDG